jgi:hypothetical protein
MAKFTVTLAVACRKRLEVEELRFIWSQIRDDYPLDVLSEALDDMANQDDDVCNPIVGIRERARMVLRRRREAAQEALRREEEPPATPEQRAKLREDLRRVLAEREKR